MLAWQKTMAICRFNPSALPAWLLASFVMVVSFSCSEEERLDPQGAVVFEAADAESPADWLEVAKASLRAPRQASFVIVSGRSSEKTGRLTFQDLTHFRVESTLTVATTEPSGDSASMQLEIVSAADGETLRIQLPAVFGAPASMAVFPVQRFRELEAVGPESPLHRYRLESLSPVHMAGALLEACSEIEAQDNDNATGSQAFTAQVKTETLIALGILDTSAQGESFLLQLNLDQTSGKFAGLQVVGARGGIVRFLMQIDDIAAPAASLDRGFSLTIPDGQVVVDLALQLPH